MNKLKVVHFLILLLTLSGLRGQEKTYSNPVISGFNPDPSICRVGEAYYLATSTFEYFPGVPIYHSKDLVNWKLIGHALHRPEQLDLEKVPSTAGIYAPTLRYHQGTFYMITTLVDGGERENMPKGNFIVTAKNPAGPWSEPHWIKDAEGIDPSLFFDDNGKVYYCGNGTPKNQIERHHKHIWIQEIDLNSFQLKGEKAFLSSTKYFEQDIIGSAVAFEAPHLYKKDGEYFLLIAHGGTGMGHAVSIWRSKSPFGPWEDNPNNPILTHRGYSESGINATGHADIIQTMDGDWWSVFLAVRSNDNKQNVMGRETFLAEVDWSGTWPVYNPKGKMGRTALVNNASKLFTGVQQGSDFEDNFDEEKLNLAWSMIRTPKMIWWDLKSEPGKLGLKLRPDEIEQFAQPSFLGFRVPEMKVDISVNVNFKPTNTNECAGLAFERGHEAEWTVVKELHEKSEVVSVYHDGKALLGRIRLEKDAPIDLKIELNNFKMTFYVRELHKDWQKIIDADVSELGFPPAGRFTGSMTGPYVSSRGKTSDQWAMFESFKLKTYSK